MKKFIGNKKVLYLLGIISFLFLWEIISLIVDENSMIFPDAFNTIKASIKLLSKGYVYKCILSSLTRMIIGFLCSIILALILGIIAGNNSKFKTLFSPYLTVLKSIPTATLIFLFLVLVGSKISSILMVILISFPILYESVSGGISSIDSTIKDTLKIEQGNEIKKIISVKLPMAVPYILVGIASSFDLSFKIEIMSEIISGDTQNGLGSAILASQKADPTNLTLMFAYSFLAIVIMLLITLLSNIIKKKINEALIVTNKDCLKTKRKSSKAFNLKKF